jgi:hypothetical protein
MTNEILLATKDLLKAIEVLMPEKAWCGWGDPNKTNT